MFSKVYSGALNGIDAFIVDVEIDVSIGLPAFDIVGLPSSSIKEAKDRVRTSIKNSEIDFPIKRITVNLAPADQRKDGASFDLPIAVGILLAEDVIKVEDINDFFIIGELSLDGNVRSVNGVLSLVHTAQKLGFKHCIIPKDNTEEASLISGINIYALESLSEVVEFFNERKIKPIKPKTFLDEISSTYSPNFDFSNVKGQEMIKRAITIAVAGYHNILVLGAPGSGKTMMARRIPTVMPSLSFEESIEVTKLYSVSNKLDYDQGLITERPFRSPHHTVSQVALAGGGRVPKPGEISLSHKGVLFLDEFPEFSKQTLEILRQPLEDKQITISRVNGTLTYPANFMLVASMNPCPCGFYGVGDKCSCTDAEVNKYLNKISGPLLDRIDIQIEAKPINFEDLQSSATTQSSQDIKDIVIRTIEIQRQRYKDDGISFNSELTVNLIDKYCKLGSDESAILNASFDTLGLSARSYHKILKIARTIADIDNSKNINVMHLTEAIHYRSLDRKYWG